MSERAQLLNRKEELYAALRTLRNDFEDGAIDPDAYEITRDRYEFEAAAVLEELDVVEDSSPPAPVPPRKAVTPGIALLLSLGIAALAVVLFLVAGLRDRAASSVAAAATAVPPPPAVIRAQNAYARHPHRLTTVMALGSAYLDGGDAVDAEVVFRQAMTLAPRDPAPETMDALALSASGHPSQAEARLLTVEGAHPRYARAWLVDGLMANHTVAAHAHTIAALRHFLTLEPHAAVSPTVHQILKRLIGTR
jgi:cytochrome c-type biogenesis protein CcmH/NrfG